MVAYSPHPLDGPASWALGNRISGRLWSRPPAVEMADPPRPRGQRSLPRWGRGRQAPPRALGVRISFPLADRPRRSGGNSRRRPRGDTPSPFSYSNFLGTARNLFPPTGTGIGYLSYSLAFSPLPRLFPSLAFSPYLAFSPLPRFFLLSRFSPTPSLFHPLPRPFPSLTFFPPSPFPSLAFCPSLALSHVACRLPRFLFLAEFSRPSDETGANLVLFHGTRYPYPYGRHVLPPKIDSR